MIYSPRVVRPAHWNLTVAGKSLAFVALHGTFPVRGLDASVAALVAMLPQGTEVSCDCDGTNVTNLHVTRIRRIITDLGPRVMELPDAIVALDGALSLVRARKRIDAQQLDAAAHDLAVALRANEELALGEFERLPAAQQAALVDLLAHWAVTRPASWRALRHLPLARWTLDHVKQAFMAALANAGTFGTAPGVDGEVLLDELARRGESTAPLTKKLARVRRVQSTEGDTIHRLSPEIDGAKVVGACAQGVYVAGTVQLGKSNVTEGARRWVAEDRHHVLVLYALDGRELKRWLDVRADRVVDDIALLVERPRERDATSRGVRLTDGAELYTFPGEIQRHDHELVWGVLDKNWSDSTMSSQVRRLTGELVLDLENVWVESLWWDRERIYVHGEAMTQTFDRAGKPLAEPPPAPATTVELDTAEGRVTAHLDEAPWRFGYWTEVVGGGWQLQWKGKRVCIAPTEPGAAWVTLELAKAPETVELAPPWVAFRIGKTTPILLIALAELMTANEIRVDGKRFAKRFGGDPRPRPPAAIAAWFEKLVAAGIVPTATPAERDFHLLRVFERETKPRRGSLALVLAGYSPYCIEHDTHYFYPDDDCYTQLSHAFAEDGIAIDETAREDDDDRPTVTLRARRGDRTVERRCVPIVDELIPIVDGMVAELGATRRLYALAQYQEDMFAYLALTPEQRAQLVAAGIDGIADDTEPERYDEDLE